MANVNVKNSTSNTGMAHRSRYEKSEIAYGRVLSTDYAVGDTLVFSEIPSQDVIYAKFVSGTASLELFNGTDVSNAINFNILAAGATANIDYVITYIRGTGKAHSGLANAGTEVSSEYGKLIQLTIQSTT